MKITIGANIKRLRTEKGVTQEQLSEAMNVTCAAVSKWERNETYPDITLLQPLAFYFGVTLDELMGYDKEKVNEEIEKTIAEYRKSDDRQIIVKAYKDYPNDYRVMYYYMWSFGIGDAEPDLELARKHKAEIEPICDRILEGCTEISLCLGAWKMKAILKHAEGKTDEALKIHAEKFGNWYFSVGQMNEQLFKKDRPEFLYWAKRNMYELVEFAADKLVKTYFYDPEIPYETMVEKVEEIVDGLYCLGCELDDGYLIAQAYVAFGRLHNDLIAREFRGGKEEDIIRITDKYLSAVAKLQEKAKIDKPLYETFVNVRSHGTDDLLYFCINCALSWNNPRNVELLKNGKYKATIEKYKNLHTENHAVKKPHTNKTTENGGGSPSLSRYV